MKCTYLKSFFIASLLVPMLHFGDEYPVGIRKPTYEVTEKAVEGSSKFWDSYPPVYFAPGMHSLTGSFGDRLSIEDGSGWIISPYDAPKLARWGAQDPLIITQNHRWFSRYTYKIINQATGSAVEANLYSGPTRDNPYTRYIMAIDSSRGELMLSDQTRWLISNLDEYGFRDWVLYDAVIIGYNSGWDSSCEGLLINVNMNQKVRARQF